MCVCVRVCVRACVYIYIYIYIKEKLSKITHIFYHIYISRSYIKKKKIRSAFSDKI